MWWNFYIWIVCFLLLHYVKLMYQGYEVVGLSSNIQSSPCKNMTNSVCSPCRSSIYIALSYPGSVLTSCYPIFSWVHFLFILVQWLISSETQFCIWGLWHSGVTLCRKLTLISLRVHSAVTANQHFLDQSYLIDIKYWFIPLVFYQHESHTT